MLNSLIILGTCAGAIVFGFFVYWIIIKIQKRLRANQSNSIKGERQTPLTITKDIDEPPFEQPLNDHSTDTTGKPDFKKEDDDWLNNGVSEASPSTIRKEDNDWLNAENNEPLETVDESSLNRATTNRPEIHIKQDGSILNMAIIP